MPAFHLPAHQVERFHNRVDKGAPDECWPWRGSITHRGYGQCNASINGSSARTHAAHRIAYQLHHGVTLPDGWGVTIDHLCHTWDQECAGGTSCPHRQCQNPDHLEAVSMAENNARKLARLALA